MQKNLNWLNAIQNCNRSELKEILQPLAKRGKEHKFYAQVFQALRIEVNKEMEVLKELLGEETIEELREKVKEAVTTA